MVDEKPALTPEPGATPVYDQTAETSAVPVSDLPASDLPLRDAAAADAPVADSAPAHAAEPVAEPVSEPVVVEPLPDADNVGAAETVVIVPEEQAVTTEPATNESAYSPTYESAPAQPPVAPVAAPVATAVAPSVQPIPEPATQYVYVQTPQPPKKKGNRGAGLIFAVLATIVYAVVFAVVIAIIALALVGTVNTAYLTQPGFYLPVLFFLVGFALLAVILNRAGWWAYVVGSILVGLFVYLGSTGLIALLNGVIFETPEDATFLFTRQLTSPVTIASALVAREVALWTGALLGRRGAKLKTRNAEAQTQFEREQAERDRADQTVA